MARKPNYQFERRERERAKAAKKAAREEAKRAKAEARKQGDDDLPADGHETAGGDTVATDAAKD